jgi:hypothetical protein
MLEKLKQLVAKKHTAAELLEKKGRFEDAYREYVKIGDYIKAAEILSRMGKWHNAANLFIQHHDIDRARRAIENCFKRNDSWESFQLNPSTKITIEDWLKEKDQTRRFVRYVQDVETNDNKGIPLIIILAEKLKNVAEYKYAAELFRKGYHLVNKGKSGEKIANEIWLRHATECYARAKMVDQAAECLRNLMMTEVKIGKEISKDYRYNPYRNYTFHLQFAKEQNFLKEFIAKLEDYDPFNIAYDLIKIDETELSIELFFKYFGRIASKHLTEEESEIRNEKVSYCLNQYVVFYRNKKEFTKAAEIALLNSQKKIAGDLYKMDTQLKEAKRKPIVQTRENLDKTFKCPVCGEEVKSGWEICPNCENVLSLNMCICGEKIKPHWKICPNCQRRLG